MDSGLDGKLSSDTVLEIQITIYVLLFSAGMLVWDMVSNIGNDYRMLVKSRWRIQSPILVYFLSRLSALGMLVTALIMGPARTEIDCHVAGIFLELFFFLVISTTTGLFALRVRAIYSGHRTVQTVFLGLWLVTAGSCILAFFVLESTSNPDKSVSSCLLVEKTIILGLIIAISAMLHDTAVFLAVCYQMYRYFSSFELEVPRSARAVKFFAPKSKNTPPLMRSLVYEGQLYYLISLFWEILVVILLIVPGIGPYYRCFMLPAHLVIVNSIACLVFRNVRLGKFVEEVVSYKNTSSRSGIFSSTASSMDVEQSPAFDDSVVFAHNLETIASRNLGHAGSNEWIVDINVGSRQTAEDEVHPMHTRGKSGSVSE